MLPKPPNSSLVFKKVTVSISRELVRSLSQENLYGLYLRRTCTVSISGELVRSLSQENLYGLYLRRTCTVSILCSSFLYYCNYRMSLYVVFSCLSQNAVFSCMFVCLFVCLRRRQQSANV